MDGIQIHPRIEEALKSAKLQEPEVILQMAASDLQRRTKLKPPDISRLKEAISEDIVQLPLSNVLGMHCGRVPKLQIHRLSTGCQVLDSFMHGGIISRGVTEVCGESGSGKTQLVLQLCLTVQLPHDLGGLDSGALYICTECIPNKRLMQMAHQMAMHSKDPRVQSKKFTDHIFLENAPDVDTFKHCLYRKTPFLLEHGKIKLLIIDSIAALVRSEFSSKDSFSRAKLLSSIGSFLHKLAREYNVPIVCVNQVTAVMDDTASIPGSKRVKPALGLSWSNLVTTRLMLSLTGRTITVRDRHKEKTSQLSARKLEVVFAPHLPSMVCPYIVDEIGIRGLGGDDVGKHCV